MIEMCITFCTTYNGLGKPFVQVYKLSLKLLNNLIIKVYHK